MGWSILLFPCARPIPMSESRVGSPYTWSPCMWVMKILDMRVVLSKRAFPLLCRFSRCFN